jgi:trimeric autotransporter adhesin
LTGRNLAFLFGGTPASLNFTFYTVNAGKLFVMESDTVSTSTTVTQGSGGSAVFYVISPSKFVAIPQSDPNPAVLVFKQSSPATTVHLSSLTLNPTTVIGGLQSSTGTVTLSGPAPGGGAQVVISSSDGAASVPSSVIVPAGATSATFTVNTSIVFLSTSVTIAASYNGTSQTASLSVLL